ncbi:MAG: tRNA (N(6)-L-threonylcarbamoyladenosine(37)-C(2))-methylthiotransferase [Nitrososphaerota archaeon]
MNPELQKVYIETYGCASNIQDTQIMKGLLLRAGYDIARDPKEADLNVINTCIVKTPTEQRIIHRIRKLQSLGKPLVVAGCMAKAEPEVVERLAPRASLVSPRSITRIADAVNTALKGGRSVFLSDDRAEKPVLPHVRLNNVVDIVEISSGCLSSCTFCQTKLARGELLSYRPDHIREAVASGLREGCKEFWLTSQDCSAYGRDLGLDISLLLKSILDRLPGKYFIRVGMMNPLHFKKIELLRLAKVYLDHRVFKFLHLCVQSGSDKVLRDMRRGYTVSDFENFVETFRGVNPRLTLMTDIIVGYPTEDVEDFEETLRLVERVRPDFVNISRFYPRPKTPAARLKTLPSREVNRRSKILTELCNEVSYLRNEEWLGWVGEVLVDEVGEGGEAIGRNFAYRPIALPGTDGRRLLGRFVEVEITEARRHCIVGRIREVLS